MMMDSIDPLENSKSALPPIKPKKIPITKSAIKSSNESVQKEFSGFAILNNTDMNNSSLLQNRRDSLEQRLIQLENSRNATFTVEMLIEFRALMMQYVPRIATFTLTIHVALLLPVLSYLRSQGIDVIPYLYIGPFLFVLPYFVLFLWEYDIVTIKAIDNKLLAFIKFLKKNAKKSVLEEDTKIENFLSGSVNEGQLKEMALYRLLSEVDPIQLSSAALLLKQSMVKSSKERNANRDSGSVVIKSDGSLRDLNKINL
jgi:hypothetical protein